MKRLLSSLVSAYCLLAGGQLAADDFASIQKMTEVLGFTEAQAKQVIAKKEKLAIKFSNLPAERKDEFNRSLRLATSLLQRNEVMKAYYNLTIAKDIFTENPSMLSNLGAVFLDMRLFKEALEVYDKAISIDPINPVFRYNLGESYFGLRQYSKALKNFQLADKLLEGKRTSALVQLSRVKQQLCLIGAANAEEQGSEKQTQYLQQYKTLNKDCSKWEYHLMYYYSLVIDEFQKGNNEAANQRLKEAEYVFSNKAKHRPYLDGLIEFGYLRSFYGGK